MWIYHSQRVTPGGWCYLLYERAGTFTQLLSHMDLLTQRAVILCLIDPLHHRGLTYFTCVALNLLLLSEPSEHILIQFPWSIMQGRRWSHFMLAVSSAGWENLMAETFIFTGTVLVTLFLQIMGRGLHSPGQLNHVCITFKREIISELVLGIIFSSFITSEVSPCNHSMTLYSSAC